MTNDLIKTIESKINELSETGFVVGYTGGRVFFDIEADQLAPLTKATFFEIECDARDALVFVPTDQPLLISIPMREAKVAVLQTAFDAYDALLEVIY